jgi:hypothetical protein
VARAGQVWERRRIMTRITRAATLTLAVAFLSSFPAIASAAPPPNDARITPQPLGTLPATVRASSAEATLDPDEPGPFCGPIKNSLWYSLAAGPARGVLAALDAEGDMDAVVEVFERQRSQLTPVSCQRTNRRGAATLDFDAGAGTDYLLRVSPLANSVADAFTLRVVVPDLPAEPPGQPLRAGGVNAAVDRFANPDDAWAIRLRKGRTYRLNAVTSGEGCAQFSLFPAGTTGFGDAEPMRTLRCGGHTVFTPPVSGRYTVLVRAPRGSRERLPYRLRVGRAKSDDSAPGLVLPDDRRVRGALKGSELDALDLYRFAIDRRSAVRFRLRTAAAFDLILMNDGGGRLACACGTTGGKRLERRIAPGRYFLAVRARGGASGSYVLSRLARTITGSRMLVDDPTLAPGQVARLTLRVTPDVDGRATLLVERFDPLAGWLYSSTLRPRVAAGAASVAFRPPSVGRWRVTGAFDGTRRASPSAGGTARFTVEE